MACTEGWHPLPPVTKEPAALRVAGRRCYQIWCSDYLVCFAKKWLPLSMPTTPNLWLSSTPSRSVFLFMKLVICLSSNLLRGSGVLNSILLEPDDLFNRRTADLWSHNTLQMVIGLRGSLNFTARPLMRVERVGMGRSAEKRFKVG